MGMEEVFSTLSIDVDAFHDRVKNLVQCKFLHLALRKEPENAVI